MEKDYGRGRNAWLMLAGIVLVLTVFLMWYCLIRTEGGADIRDAVLVRTEREECTLG